MEFRANLVQPLIKLAISCASGSGRFSPHLDLKARSSGVNPSKRSRALLFSTAFCPNTPPTCALNRALVFAPLVPFRLPPAAPTTEATAPVCALISSLICSGNRLGLNFPLIGSMAVRPSALLLAAPSAALTRSISGEEILAKVPILRSRSLWWLRPWLSAVRISTLWAAMSMSRAAATSLPVWR